MAKIKIAGGVALVIASLLGAYAIAGAQTATTTSSSTATSTATSTASSTLPEARLNISKSVSTSTPHEGDTIHYIVSVSALGPATSTGVTVNDVMPSGVSFISATVSQGSFSSSSGIWQIGTMAPNTTATLNIAASVNSGTTGDTVKNSATVYESSSVSNSNVNTSSSVSFMVASTTATSTATSTVTGTSTTPGIIQIAPTLSIDAKGNFSSRGMLVTSVGSSSIGARVWGIDYTINLSNLGNSDFTFNNGRTSRDNSMEELLEQIETGDQVTVSGTITSSTPLTIMAKSVRDLSISGPRNVGDDNGNGNGNNNGNNGTSTTSTSTATSTTGSGNASSGVLSSIQGQLNALISTLQNIQNLIRNRFGM